MVRRRKQMKVAERERLALQPMAARLGLDVSRSLVEPPLSMEAQTLGAYRVAQTLLLSWTTPAAWPQREPGEHAPESVRGAGRLAEVMQTGSCNDAVAWLATNYGRQMAQEWRYEAAADPADPDDPDNQFDAADIEYLLGSAQRSEDLAASAEQHWPVVDRFGAIEMADRSLARWERALPEASDVRDARRMHAVLGATGLALGRDLDHYRELLTAGLQSASLANVSYQMSVTLAWNRDADLWLNLLLDRPWPWVDMLEARLASDAERASRTGG